MDAASLFALKKTASRVSNLVDLNTKKIKVRSTHSPWNLCVVLDEKGNTSFSIVYGTLSWHLIGVCNVVEERAGEMKKIPTSALTTLKMVYFDSIIVDIHSTVLESGMEFINNLIFCLEDLKLSSTWICVRGIPKDLMSQLLSVVSSSKICVNTPDDVSSDDVRNWPLMNCKELSIILKSGIHGGLCSNYSFLEKLTATIIGGPEANGMFREFIKITSTKEARGSLKHMDFTIWGLEETMREASEGFAAVVRLWKGGIPYAYSSIRKIFSETRVGIYKVRLPGGYALILEEIDLCHFTVHFIDTYSRQELFDYLKNIVKDKERVVQNACDSFLEAHSDHEAIEVLKGFMEIDLMGEDSGMYDDPNDKC